HDQHPALSYMIARYAKPLCPYCAKSILYHHTPYQEIREDKTIVIFSNVLKMADTISLIVLRNEDEELTLELFQRIIDSILKNTTVLDEVKKVALQMVQDYKILCELLDDDPRFSSQRRIDSLEFQHLARILASLLDMRSPYTRNHTFLASKFAEAVTRELLTEEDSRFVNLAMLLHDLGKLKTPLSVLHKPARLNEKELYIMKMHVVDTYRMLENAGLINFAKVSASHHERLDGSGYPMGLKAEKISIYQRIIQMCDVFSALIEHRPYREALSVEQAIEVISKEVEEGKLDKTVYEKLRELVKNEFFPETGVFQNVLESILNVNYEEVKEKIKIAPFEEG
ncbi:HD domain-containing phosphohydrolase, partial [Pseudothermotoga sp.]|uniref:HD-GYP domain-containing protein n=1 Tax=Pseudothermotoga sp. TaxID=2033661 RepID=UPI0031F70DCC